MTILDILQDPKFEKKAILEKLIMHACSLSKEELFLKAEQNIAPEHETWIRDGYKAYTVDKQPLEYIIGSVQFLGVDFKVNSNTLIPRPETEYMIQAVNEYIAEHAPTKQSLIDVGTGSGVLGLSAMLHNPNMIKEAYLTELSEAALTVAQENHELLSSKGYTFPGIQRLQASLLDHVAVKNCFQEVENLLLVANLPYIPEELFENNTDQTVKKREPKMAFVGGDDGCDLYRDMFNQILAMDKPENQAFSMFLEMMTWQVDILRQEYGHVFSFEEVKTFHFNIRIVQANIL